MIKSIEVLGLDVGKYESEKKFKKKVEGMVTDLAKEMSDGEKLYLIKVPMNKPDVYESTVRHLAELLGKVKGEMTSKWIIVPEDISVDEVKVTHVRE